MRKFIVLFLIPALLVGCTPAMFMEVGNKLPPDIKQSTCFLGVFTKEDYAADFGEVSVVELKNAGLKIEKSCFFSDNPTLRLKMRDYVVREMKSKNLKYKYFIKITYGFNPMDNSYNYILGISEFDIDHLLYKKDFYVIMNNDFKELFNKLNKNLNENK